MKPLKALIVEDSKDDAALLLRHLATEGYDVRSQIVQTAAEMKAALAELEWDVILSDYTMPHFTGLDALRLLKKSGRDIPIIIISGAIGEDTAVEAMLVGVNDYLIKGNLTRLAPAVERELENAARRRAQKQVEESLRRSEASLANAQRIAHIGSWDADLINNKLFWSEEVYRIFGLSKTRFGGTYEAFFNTIHPEDRQKVQSAMDATLSQFTPYSVEHRIIRPDGVERIVSALAEITFDESGKPLYLIGTVQDITERKRDEAEKARLTAQIEQQHERLNNIIDNVAGVVWEAYGKPDEATQKIDFISDYVEALLGYTVEEWLGTPNFWLSIVHPEDKEWIARFATENFLKNQNYTEEFRWIAKDGRTVWVNTLTTVICDKAGQPIGLRGINIDITERKQLEEERTKLIAELDFEKARLQHIFDNSPSFIVSMRGPEFVFEMANPAYYQLVGQRDLIGIPAIEALPELATQGLSEIIRQVYNTGEPFIGNEVPVKLEPPNGSEPEHHYINFVYMPLREADNSISGIVSYGVDVTEQVLSRTKIQESEERYRFLFDKNPLPMWAYDLETFAFLSVNDAAVTRYGYSREEFLTMTVKDIRPPEDVSVFLENVVKDIPGIRNAGVGRHIKKDGTVIDVEIITNQLIFNGKKAKLVLANDVTERKLADRKIRESEERYRIVAETANDVIITIDEHSSILFVNSAMERTLGYKPEELIGKNLSIIIPERLRTAHRAGISRYMQTGKKHIPWSGMELHALHRGGGEIQIEISFSEYRENDKRFFTAVIRDITERKRAERLILESEEKYRSIVETASEGILLSDIEGRAIFVNRQMPEMLGYTADEMLGRTIFDFIFEEDFNDTKQKIERREQGEAKTSEIRLRRKDGTEIICLHKSSPARNQAGEITGYLTMNTDITERKNAERELQYAEAKYRSLVESSPAIIYLAEPNPPYSPVYVSPNIAQFGYTNEEWFSRDDLWISVIHPEDKDRVLRITAAAMREGLETDIEYRISAADQTIHWLRDRGRFVSDERGNRTGWQGVMLDITETKVLEEQLRHSQKLESVGLLAGGIAHDFNNMLTAINGYSDLTLRRLGKNDPIRSNIEEIRRAGQRSADLTQQLLAFSRQQVLQPIILDINAAIGETGKMLQRVLGEDIQLTTTLNPRIGRIKADPGQLSQIIMNLAVNARDAMPQGGKLTIETGNVFLDPDYARRHAGVLPGAYVMLAVSDNGTGMSDSTKEHIFDPFFTTKEVGQGTGLGLATVYGIVRQSGGNIEVYSEQEVGTTFKVYLPRVADQAAPEKIKEFSAELPRGTETILLVEDEDIVRHLSQQILEECGYTVIEARNGLHALEICGQADYKFDLLITDVVMPQMGGPELAQRLKSKLPDIKILFTSGYTDDAVVRHGVIEADTNFIQKPFSPEKLAEKIRKILDNN